MSDKETEGQNQVINKKGGKNKALVVIGVVIVVLLIAVLAVILLKKNDKVLTEDEPSKREIIVNEENVQEVAQQLSEAAIEHVPPGQYTATMNYEWHFKTGDSESYDSYVANDLENTNDVYFDIFLAEDADNEDNPIYESPVIPRGNEIKNIRLKKDLDPGTYDCVLVYHLVDEEQSTVGTASFTLKIVIEG